MTQTTETTRGEATMGEPALDEAAIRANEREKLAALIEEHAEVLASAGTDKVAAVKLVALAMRLTR
jgi:hypothetical protein